MSKDSPRTSVLRDEELAALVAAAEKIKAATETWNKNQDKAAFDDFSAANDDLLAALARVKEVM